jgi:hypothetical protein
MTGPDAIDLLPDSIRIGAFDFAIVRWTHHEATDNQRWGEFSSIMQRICIQRDMPTVFKAVDTFLHEVTHGLFWTAGLKDDDKEERIVTALGAGWMQIHRDNPWLALWLTQAFLK